MKGSILLTVAGVAAAVAITSAQTTRVDRFTATIVNVTDTSGNVLNVDVIRWSTDAERDAITAALGKGETALADALKMQPTVGYIWTGESVGYPIKMAVRQTLPNGGDRVIFATDRRLGAYQPRPWSAAPPATTQAYPFAILELRVPKGGAGEGKISLNAKVGVDQEAKSIALDNYAAAPIVFKNVRRPTGT